jgi:hypothetical protein
MYVYICVACNGFYAANYCFLKYFYAIPIVSRFIVAQFLAMILSFCLKVFTVLNNNLLAILKNFVFEFTLHSKTKGVLWRNPFPKVLVKHAL